MLDTTGAEIGPMLQDAADRHGIPVLLLLACAKAESGLDPNAFRDGVWPDVSVGLCQQAIAYAPFGDHSASPANVAYIRQLLSDPARALDVGAAHLDDDLAAAKEVYPQATGDELLLLALSRYNSGNVQGPGNWWWSSEEKANYAAALTWAKDLLQS